MQSSKKLHRAYDRKEQLRNALHCGDAEVAKKELKKFVCIAQWMYFLNCLFMDRGNIKQNLETWIQWTKRSRIEIFKKLGEKIQDHLSSIINTIEQKMNNARIEATNNKIKLIIKRGYGYRNIENLTDLILVTCSNKYKTLPNRGNLSRVSGNWRSYKIVV